MKLELCALILVVAFSLGQGDLLERRPEFAQYQDAWKMLKIPGKYYLFMRSYEKEPFYKHKKCVFNELLSVNEKKRCTVNIIGATDPTDGSKSNRTAYAWVRASEGYPFPNVIQSSVKRECPSLSEYLGIQHGMINAQREVTGTSVGPRTKTTVSGKGSCEERLEPGNGKRKHRVLRTFMG
ncbi:hypothetical protein HPB50_007043 [Hyalomma asiaticum]|uniref:Uncharacterized protein n=1 Tax=Hyalomma asiaticum TaxID=266040 RepID=A0ACB7SZQ1_HYAAI|nr:hypothetical protein HPB50_007043 [Hyalomma asiaticum]